MGIAMDGLGKEWESAWMDGRKNGTLDGSIGERMVICTNVLGKIMERRKKGNWHGWGNGWRCFLCEIFFFFLRTDFRFSIYLSASRKT